MTLLEEIELKIRDAILDGKYRSGERLIEADLIRQFKVSRTIIRETLRNLSVTGLLSYVPKKGHSVKKFSIDDIKYLYDLIEVLEAYACKVATPLLHKKDIDKLKYFNLQMSEAMKEKDYPKYRAFNTDFHGLFVKKSGNGVLQEMIDILRTRIYTYRYLSLMNSDAMSTYLKQHEAIISFANKKNIEKTKSEMKNHIHTAKTHLVVTIQNSPLL